MFCKFITDVASPEKLGPLHAIVQLGLQSAVQVIGPTFSPSFTVKDISAGDNTTEPGPSAV